MYKQQLNEPIGPHIAQSMLSTRNFVVLSVGVLIGFFIYPVFICRMDYDQPIDYNFEVPGMRHPLYVGVVTSSQFLSTRAAAVHGTWATQTNKTEYFVAEGKGSKSLLPVVSLPGVDDTYPPQKKVYRMLAYMHDNYIDQYNWFLRADDDVYVRVPELLKFLSKLDPTEPLYIGSPGFGEDKDSQRLKLYLHERYCMGGTGVVFSRGLLKRLAPHLDDCLKNVVVSYNEDVEVGRCISRRLGIQCTWSYEMSDLFYFDYSEGAMFKNDELYNNRKFTSAITVHSFKSPDMMYRAHQFFLEINLKKEKKNLKNIKQELKKVQEITGLKSQFF